MVQPPDGVSLLRHSITLMTHRSCRRTIKRRVVAESYSRRWLVGGIAGCVVLLYRCCVRIGRISQGSTLCEASADHFPNIGAMDALARLAELSESGYFEEGRVTNEHDENTHVFVKLGWRAWHPTEADIQAVYLMRNEKDMFRYGSGFDHPCKWYDYCRQCGTPCLLRLLDATRIEPIGITWKSRGLRCNVCHGKVWRVGSELYSALFLREVPMGVYRVHGASWLSPESRSRAVRYRVVRQCLWCKRGMGQYGTEWNWMVCTPCKDELEDLITGWLSVESCLPSVVVDRIVGFVFK